MQNILQNTSGNTENDEAKISSMVDSRVNSHEEKNQRPKKRYQRATNNENLRDSRKNQYHEEKTKYQAALKNGKIESWKEFCNLTLSTDPWNAVFKLASNKVKRSETLQLYRYETPMMLIRTKILEYPIQLTS